MGPEAGVVPLALEALQTGDIRLARGREIARRHDAIARGRGLAGVCRNRPGVRRTVKDSLFDPGVEFDVAPQVEAIGHMVDVAQDLGLRAVALRPMPLLLQLVGEGIRVFQALHVAAAPGIAVPVPSAAHPVASLESAHAEAELAQAMDRVEAAEPGAYNDRVISAVFRGVCRHSDLLPIRALRRRSRVSLRRVANFGGGLRLED